MVVAIIKHHMTTGQGGSKQDIAGATESARLMDCPDNEVPEWVFS